MAVEKTIKLKVESKDAVKGIDQVEKGVKGVDKSAKGAKSGLGGMTGAAKGLGVAFKALGIGLIVAAFMKLKDIFSGNIETARMFERVSSQLSAAFDVLRDRTELFIQKLIELKNPFKAIKESFAGVTGEIKEETKAMGELTRKLQEVRDEERAMITVRAQANKIIAESRLLAEDETKTIEERLVALKAAVAEEQRVADLELETQRKKVEALQAVIDLGKSSEEDMIELENERARFLDLQTASVLKQKRVVTEINTMERELAADQKKRGEQEKTISLEKLGNQQKELDNLDEIMKRRKKIATETSNFEIKTEQLTADAKKQIVMTSLNQVASALGESSKTGKALAIATTLIDTYQGATKALAQGGLFGTIGAAGIVAAGLGNVAKIKATKLPFGDSDSGSSVSSGSPSVPQSGLGGSLVPNLEGIQNVAVGETQPVQAFVVENDISNAQALQEELDIQATL